ncbi:GM26658 [Drosophila sechellia]|uniref:GM26658 n=1 Tax=Drosophila sechellia TaxID=7238 RepID=B4IQ79_DROSE|nr:GM26658 [Drosophila sechellia]
MPTLASFRRKAVQVRIRVRAFPTKKRLVSHLRVHNKESPVTATAAIQSINPQGRQAGAEGAGGSATNLHITEVPEQPVSTSKVVMVL